MEKLNLDKETLKKFSRTMFVALTIIGVFLLLRQKENFIWFHLIGASLLLLGIFATNILKPIYIIWMRFAYILAWINTRLILMIMFYLVFTPIGLGMKLFGVDLLDRKIDKNRDTYWITKEKKEFNPKDYERQF